MLFYWKFIKHKKYNFITNVTIYLQRHESIRSKFNAQSNNFIKTE